MTKIIESLFRHIKFRSHKLRISVPGIQIANAYLSKSEMSDTAANDWFKCFIVTIRKNEWQWIDVQDKSLYEMLI